MPTMELPPESSTESVMTTSAPSGPSSGVTASFGLTGLVIFCAVLGTLFLVKKKCRKSSSSSSESRSEITSDDISDVFVQEDRFVRHTQNWTDTSRLKDSIKTVLIDARRLQIQQIIGNGQFGCVYAASLSKSSRRSNDYGEVSHDKVAVKVLKDDEHVNSETVEAFLQEGLIMKDFCHRNVLTLLGVAIGQQGLPMIVLPFMLYGNLKKYISNPVLMITVRELIEFGKQIAEGMQYLSKQKFVHRDLALRNCMLDEAKVVKVADFGLSRDIYSKEYYASHNIHALLPVKWMAIESLTKSVYTTHTDVWAYGVLLWELLTRGAMPYSDISNWEVKAYVKCGRRLEQPESCPEELYKLMTDCWNEDPLLRPSFTSLIDFFKEVLGPKETDSVRRGAQCAYIKMYSRVDLPTPPPMPSEQGSQSHHPLQTFQTMDP